MNNDDRFEHAIQSLLDQRQADQRLLAAYDDLQKVAITYAEAFPCVCHLGWHCWHCKLDEAVAAIEHAQPAAVLPEQRS